MVLWNFKISKREIKAIRLHCRRSSRRALSSTQVFWRKLTAGCVYYDIATHAKKSKRLCPLTATAGISTGHDLTEAEIVVLQGRCFHSYDDELYAEVKE